MAFAHCDRLTSITIPKSVTQIGDKVFKGCHSLTEIAVSPENPCYQSIEGVLFSKDGSTIYCCPAGRNGAYRIPDHVTTIGNAAFVHCSGLTEITIPKSVIQIGELAFPGDEHLTIYAQKGSCAWKYAQDRGLQWSEPTSRFTPQTSESMGLWRRLFERR